MTKDEALKLAREHIEGNYTVSAEEALAAIKEALAQPERDYERGFIDGMQKQMQSSVDKAVNRMAQPEQEPWRGLDWGEVPEDKTKSEDFLHGARWAEKQLKEKNNA